MRSLPGLLLLATLLPGCDAQAVQFMAWTGLAAVFLAVLFIVALVAIVRDEVLAVSEFGKDA